MSTRAVAFCVGYAFIILAFVVTLANYASHLPVAPSARPSRFVTVTPGPTHTICLRIKEEVVPGSCQTVYGAATVSIHIITTTPLPTQ